MRTSDNDVSSLRVVVWGGLTRDKGERGGEQRDEAYVRAGEIETLLLWSVLGEKHQLCRRVQGQQQASEHETRKSARARGRAKAQHAYSASLLGGAPQGRGAGWGSEREKREWRRRAKRPADRKHRSAGRGLATPTGGS